MHPSLISTILLLRITNPRIYIKLFCHVTTKDNQLRIISIINLISPTHFTHGNDSVVGVICNDKVIYEKVDQWGSSPEQH